MAVRSQEIQNGERTPPRTHLVEADTLVRAQPQARRFIAFGLMILSILGTVFAFDEGDTSALFWRLWTLDPVLLRAIGFGLAAQIVLTIMQLIFCKPWWNPIYLITILASAGSSFLGFRVLVAVPLVSMAAGKSLGDVFESRQALANAGMSAILWSIGVSFVVFIVFIAVDVIPERVLVKH